jgi:hypothetical protein
LELRAHTAGTLHDAGRAFSKEGIQAYENTKNWLDQSVCWVIPTRGFYPAKVVDSWDTICWPMNQQRTPRLAIIGMEVGDAYNTLFKLATDREFCAKHYDPTSVDLIQRMKFILTTEEDNILPPNAVEGLFAALYTCPDCKKDINPASWTCEDGHRGYDAVSGLYFTKSMPPRPMAYGHPSEPDSFKPVSVAQAIKDGSTIEVNGIAMGCAIWRKELFAQVAYPWFETVDGGTQDLVFCKRAKEQANARFGVNAGVRVGHLDIKTGVLY